MHALVALDERRAASDRLDGKHNHDRLGRGEGLVLVRAALFVPSPGDGRVAAVPGGVGVRDRGVVLVEMGDQESARPAAAEEEDVDGRSAIHGDGSVVEQVERVPAGHGKDVVQGQATKASGGLVQSSTALPRLALSCTRWNPRSRCRLI